MMTRLSGAAIRAVFMILLVAMPSLLLPGTSADTAQTVALIAILAMVFTFMEYASKAPSLVEFRDAPPFNRIRFGALFVTVLMITLVLRAQAAPSTMTQFAAAAGQAVGDMIDFPYSPVRLLVLMLPAGSDAGLIADVRVAAGLSYLVSILALAIFVLILRLAGWPSRKGGFNVWVNLPTFDPTAGGDVVHRLERDAQVNLILGFLLPFVIPAVVKLAADAIEPVNLANHHVMIWTVTAWAFLPASLLMRGIALSHVAAMICRQRARAQRRDAGNAVPLAR